MESPILQSSILDAVFSHEETQPEGVAYTLLSSDESIFVERTFADFAQQVRRIAAALRQVTAVGDRVLLVSRFGAHYLEAFLGCLERGVIAVPAYPPRSNRGDRRLTAIAKNCEPTIAICDSDDCSASLRSFPNVRMISIESLLSETFDVGGKERAHRGRNVDPNRPAYLQYTSGSTSTPKGVVVTHGNLLANSRAIQTAFQHNQSSINVTWLPMFHDMGLVGSLQGIYVGFHTVLLPTNVFAARPRAWMRAISKYRATTSGGPNFSYQSCIDRISDEEAEQFNLSSWRVAFNGGESVRGSTLQKFLQRFAKCGFREEAMFPCYGLAESTLYVSGGPVDEPPREIHVDRTTLGIMQTVSRSDNAEASVALVSVGLPDSNTEVAIVDPTARTRLKERQVGEIWLKGPSVGNGYWNHAQGSSETFHGSIADSTGNGYLRTGDLGFMTDGELYVNGRYKDLIIVNGQNVYPQDIEAEFELELSYAWPNSSAAFGIQKDAEEVVVIVAESSRQLYRDARNGQLDRLADEVDDFRQTIWNLMNLHIWQIDFVRPGSFPRTTSGKVQRGICRSEYLSDRLDTAIRIPFKADPVAVIDREGLKQ